MNSENSYLIPSNVKTRFEFFTGFGFKELFFVLGGFAIGGIISFIIFLLTHSIFSIIIAVFGGASGFFLGKTDPRTGASPYKLFIDLRDYNSKPKHYKYKFGEGRK